MRIPDQQNRLFPIKRHIGALAFHWPVLSQRRVPVFFQIIHKSLFLRKAAKDWGFEGRPADVHHFLAQVEGHECGPAFNVPNSKCPIGGGGEEDFGVEGVVLDLLLVVPCTLLVGGLRMLFGIDRCRQSNICGYCPLRCPGWRSICRMGRSRSRFRRPGKLAPCLLRIFDSFYRRAWVSWFPRIPICLSSRPNAALFRHSKSNKIPDFWGKLDSTLFAKQGL